MSEDIQPLLDDWPYETGQLCVRKITGNDGREKIQLRIEMGILQMDVDGRPDGQRPHGHDSLLDFYESEANEANTRSEDYVLTPEHCMSLQMEALQYYHRRISFLEMGEYEKAQRDAERNLALFDFVKEYAEDEDDRLAFEHYRPFVISHRVRAEALIQLQRDAYDQAIHKIDAGIREIQAFFEAFDRPDLVDESDEIAFLKEWADEIRKDQPKSLSQDLSDQLKDAVAHEDFERAAELRDQLMSLNSNLDIS